MPLDKGSKMVKNICFVCFLCTLLLVAACTDDDGLTPGPAPSLSLSGPDLLGLVDGRTLEYLRTDTLVTWIPDYRVQEDTGTEIISIVGSGSDWIIRNDTVPLLNLKVSDPFILHNGYWRKVGQSDALVYFPVPAIAIDRSATQDEPWSGFIPAYTSDSGSTSYVFYYGYFGFYFTKSFSGTEQIFVPAFGGNAFRHVVKLFRNQGDTDPVATVVEHYAPGIGLVRQELRAEGLVRTLSLRAYR
jgi:hypothetical protein